MKEATYSKSQPDLQSNDGIEEKIENETQKSSETSYESGVVYVTVDCTNEPALNLYSSLGFDVVVDERDLIVSRRDRGPRLFMRRSLTS